MILSSETLRVPKLAIDKTAEFQESDTQMDKETLKDDGPLVLNQNLLDALKPLESNNEEDSPRPDSPVDSAVRVEGDNMVVDDIVSPPPVESAPDSHSVDKVASIKGFHILENILETRLPIDTVISCSDGKIGAHRIVLAAVSPFLGMLFDDQKLGEVAVLILPDIKKRTMETLLHLAYTGKMIFSPEREQEVYSALECLMFGQMVQLDLTMVTVKTPEPARSAVPGSSRAMSSHYGGPSSSGSSGIKKDPEENPSSFPSESTATARKRRLSESAGGRGGKRQVKKSKFDKNGKQVQLAVRSGVPIGKDGARKLRKKEQKRILRDASYIIHPPRLVSDPETGTIKLNARKMPITSVRLRKLSDFVCIEFHQKNDQEWKIKQEGDIDDEENEQGSTVSESIGSDNIQPQDCSPTEDNSACATSSSNTEKDAEIAAEDDFNNFADSETQLITFPETAASDDSQNVSEDHSCAQETEDTESGFADHENEMAEGVRAHTDHDRDPESEGKILEQNSPVSMTCSDSDRMDLTEKGVTEMESDKLGIDSFNE